jgi:hypothetical protein
MIKNVLAIRNSGPFETFTRVYAIRSLPKAIRWARPHFPNMRQALIKWHTGLDYVWINFDLRDLCEKPLNYFL